MARFRITKYGYKYDTYIFKTLLILIYIFAFSVFYINDFNFSFKPYMVCEGLTPCENPFYQSKCYYLNGLINKPCEFDNKYSWVNDPYVYPGEYGTSVPNYIKYYGFIYFVLILIAYLLNHYFHNKGVMFDIEYKLTKNKTINFRDLFKKYEGLEEY